jgi:hypothetical protein
MRIDRNVDMEMRDGTILRADIYRPDDKQKHPAILTRFFNKAHWPRRTSLLDYIDAVDAGYALVTQDVRGRGASDGEWELMSSIEAQDGYDSVEWVSRQSWCDGNVGMMGFSHGGALTWQTAAENPPHLKAIAPWSSGGSGSHGEVSPVSGGATQFMNTLSFMTVEGPEIVDRLEKEGQDVTEMRRAFDWAISNPDEYYHFLPLKDMPIARFESIGRMWSWRLRPPQARNVDRLGIFKKVMVPGYHLTGWYDILEFNVIGSFNNMRELGGSQLAREGQHLIIGPWSHGDWLLSYLAGIHFGESVAARTRNLASDGLLTFFDRYLRGKDVKIPAIKYFVMGRNKWQIADTWPLPGTQWQRFFLHSKGHANTSTGDGMLNRENPGSEPADMFIYNPYDPVPTAGGPTTSPMAGFGFVSGPLEQSYIEQRNDILCYTTPELKEDTEVSGPLQLHLFAATSARDTDFTAKLLDVYPNGRSHNVAEGIIRCSGSKSESHKELLKPGEINGFVIGMGNTSQLFRKGHHIRIDISSSNFPLYDRNMNTGNLIGEDTYGIPALQNIYHEAEYVSYIDLPVINKPIQ